jgi:hypothetical protein
VTRRIRSRVLGCALCLVALAPEVTATGAAEAGTWVRAAANGTTATAAVSRCIKFPQPTMPPSTGTQTPAGFTVEMAGAVLAPASAASTLPSAYT